jgi:lipid-A-disaccharide synthase
VSSDLRTILLSCGEASGDLYLAEIARALLGRRPGWRLVGVIGPHGRKAGVHSWGDISELTVMGFGEVLRHLPHIWSFGNSLVKRATKDGVDLFLPVDYPGFHLRVAGRLRRQGVPVLDFIPPKTWSWGRWRLRSLRKNVDRCGVIFPFEQAHYREAGVDATFVGHPLLQLHRERLAAMEKRSSTQIHDARAEASLLLVPGSRAQELARLTPVLAEVVRRWRRNGATAAVRISRAPNLRAADLDPLRQAVGECEIAEGPLFDAFLESRAAIVCSGTATVEAALAGCPHLIVYRTGALSYALARRLATVEHIGMANLVLGRRAFPEFVQKDCESSAIAEALERLEADSDERSRQRAASDELRRALAGPGCFDAVAEMAIEMVESASV